ncbi:hypothetical protein DPMN_105110 [Dreissena polymorpha]|uniref:Uncharacterized protein n=1 Tax=Dreissena polymorpha TaxID=45954 RepID=A0A9D4HD85_DREPO|nr:hypothetical protein DPMN_105110 [Dreissena polymorpha]
MINNAHSDLNIKRNNDCKLECWSLKSFKNTSGQNWVYGQTAVRLSDRWSGVRDDSSITL